MSDRAFGLVIEGESMFEEFYPGDIVILDTELPPQPGDFVVAKLDKEEKVTFRGGLGLRRSNYARTIGNTCWEVAFKNHARHSAFACNY